MKLQSPAGLTDVAPSGAPLRNRLTEPPASAVPLKVTGLAIVAPEVGAVTTGAGGGTVSTVQV
ncbi:hypothetical protein D3C72_1051660 [compost metagenome]